MKIIAPFISCFIEASDTSVDNVTPLDQAIADGYSQIYIATTEGVFKYHVLRPGVGGKRRFICLPVKDVPGIVLPKATAGVQFLPDGKIPMALFEEVKEFFKQVISKKGRALEAMIWVLWNETDGYYLHVPSQVVGHASATYDWSSLPDGSSIIVDIHSHADFNAFFSSTDDRDDTGCIRFSGVIGHNDKPERSMKFRFNYLGQRMEVQLTDLFEREEQEVSIPEAWFDNVNLATPAAHGYQGKSWSSSQGVVYGGMSGYHGRSYMNGQDSSPAVKSVSPTKLAFDASRSNQKEASDAEQEAESTPTESRKDRKRREKMERVTNRQQVQNTTTSELSKGSSESEEGGPEQGSRFLDTGNGMVQIGNLPLKNGASTTLAERHSPVWGNISEEARRIIGQQMAEEDSLSQQAEDYLNTLNGGSDTVEAHGYTTAELDLPPDFDTIAVNHGVQVARAFTAIDNATTDLIHAPEVMKRCVSDMFNMLENSMKLKAFREMAECLSAADRDSLATNGL